MSRAPGNADKLMIAAGVKIARERGCAGVRIRELARQAGVNLGMFHYHFKNKNRFTRVLLQEMYEGFFARLAVASREGAGAMTRLRNSLVLMGLFIRDERHLVTAIFRDLAADDAEVLKFVRTNVPRHAAVIKDLLELAHEEGNLPAIPFPQAIGFIMGALNLPTIVGGLMEKSSWKKLGDPVVALSDRAIEQRVEMLLHGLKEYRA